MIIKLQTNSEYLNKHKFIDVADDWAREAFPQLAYRTLSCYKAPLKKSKLFFYKFYIEDITHADIEDFFEFLLSNNYSKKTFKNYKIVLNMIFKYALINDYIDKNNVADIPIPKGLTTSHRMPPAEEEIEKIKNSIDKTFGLFFYLILYTGLRRGEALALTYEDIDFQENIIHINKSLYHKNNKPEIKEPKTQSGIRDIPLLLPLKSVLNHDGKGVIFCDDHGNYLKNSQVERQIFKYHNESGTTCTPHEIRHGYATMLHEAGVIGKDAQYLLGHANIATTEDIYTHITNKHLDKTARIINDFIS